MMFKVLQNGQPVSQQVIIFPGPIPPNGFSNAQAVDVHFPSEGYWQVQRIVDDLNQVDEGTFENNNTKTSNVTVSGVCQ